MNKIKSFYLKLKEKNVILLCSLIYSFLWSVAKIVFGVITGAYFFCISGASTQLIGFVKKIYFSNSKSEDENKAIKSITISILIIISSALFVFYMARLFFISEVKNYGLIMSITIATFSFAELTISIINFVKAKKSNDMLLQAYKGCSLESSCFAIVLTQVALLSATNSTNNFYNGITGVVLGSFSILIGVYLLIVSLKNKKLQSEQKQAEALENT